MNLITKHNSLFFFEILFITIIKNNVALPQNFETSKTLWGLNVGYFPNINNDDQYFVSSGISASFTSETLFASKLNLGWYLLFRKTFKEEFENLKSEGLSLMGTLSYLWKIDSGKLFLRTGIGLGYPVIYLTLINLIALEYQFQFSEKITLSISLVEEMARFQYPLPPIINVGIVF